MLFKSQGILEYKDNNFQPKKPQPNYPHRIHKTGKKMLKKAPPKETM